MAPMTRARAGEDEVPSDLAPAYYAQRAGAGLIVTEATAADHAEGDERQRPLRPVHPGDRPAGGAGRPAAAFRRG
ncbi:hypothetical protein M5E06_21275 [Azospirillum sp. A1-3]|uniref:hypothetical protein n=1 Tax=Azospirillum sp. A1-3 TaxID=185874 RepID=UPI00207704D3|nr:hypothetical protein [Azospirillum sp. A1-3]MCM8736662.1 hypothetical protein [Azospirillum sp. A1-3]